MTLRFWPLLALLSLNACFTMHNLTPVSQEKTSGVKEVKASTFDPTNYQTFSVFPLSLISGDKTLRDLGYEEQLLFSLRNAIEAKGYRFVDIDRSPDFLVTVDLMFLELADFRMDMAIEPAAPAPLTPPGFPSGVAALAPAARPQLAAARWGHLSAGPATVSSLPGYPPRDGILVPSERRFSNQVTVGVIDGASLSEVWTGTAIGISRATDPRIGSQAVLWRILEQFPPAAVTRIYSGSVGVEGLELGIATNDGHAFFPVALAMAKDSAAWTAGMKNYDMILAIGGEETKNKPISAIKAAMEGPEATELNMTLWRQKADIWRNSPIMILWLSRRGKIKYGRGSQMHVSVVRSGPLTGKSSPAALEPARYFDIPRKAPAGPQACLLPATGCMALAILLYAGITLGN